jgi:uncharacterized protein
VIAESELRRVAASSGYDIMAQDIDYCLGCLLYSLFRLANASTLIFKGGTCLRKCYFDNYRLSEDLDFTAPAGLTQTDFERVVEEALVRGSDYWGIDFRVRAASFREIKDEYGNASLKARAYYRGPLRRSGDPRGIDITATIAEAAVFPVAERQIAQGLYSDDRAFRQGTVRCYDLREILAEKIRAMFGQRRFVISRDLYDAYFLLESGVSLEEAREALPRKFEVKCLGFDGLNIAVLLDKKDEFERDWQTNLLHLLPDPPPVIFEEAWAKLIESLG